MQRPGVDLTVTEELSVAKALQQTATSVKEEEQMTIRFDGQVAIVRWQRSAGVDLEMAEIRPEDIAEQWSRIAE